MIVKSSIFRLLILCFLIWAGLFYSSIESTVAIWYRSETFAHCFIILPICIYLIKLRWQQLNQAEIKPNLKVLLLVLPIMCLWLFGALAELLVIEQGATFLILPFIIWTVMGNKIARILAFTMAFWMFSVPVGEFLIPQLQELTADITVWALQLSGIPVYREGLYLAVPGGLFEVAVACSGIRYLIASFTLGTLYAYLNYNSPKKRTLFILFSVILPLFANGIRAFGIVLIAYLSDMKYATGVDHLIYGWFFFGVVILIMFAIGNIWADPIEKEETENLEPINLCAVSPSIRATFFVSVIVGLSFLYKYVVQNPVSSFVPKTSNVFVSEQNIDDTSWLPNFYNPTLVAKGNYEGIDYYLAYYDSNRQGQELINSENRLYNIEAWSLMNRSSNGHFSTLEVTNLHGSKRLLSYTYVTPWVSSPSAIKVKLSQAIQALLGIPQNGFVLVMSVKLDESGENRNMLEEKVASLVDEQLWELVKND